MQLSLFNASASFQGYIDKIWAEKFDIFAIIYLNDIFIYIKDLKQAYVDIISWVLDIL